MKKKSINLIEEAKPIKIIKKGKISRYDYFDEITSNYIPFDNIDDIYQEPGMTFDNNLQREVDKLLD